MNLKTILFAFSTILAGCHFSSNEELKQIAKPDLSALKEFKLKQKGKILYEMYQEYGLTDIEAQLIVVIRPDKAPDFKNRIPVPLLNSATRINTEKFSKMPVFRFEYEEQAMAHIRNTGLIYKPDTSLQFTCRNATYKIIENTSEQIIMVYDKQNNILYIEAKK